MTEIIFSIENYKNLMLSASGFIIIFYILEKTAGLRYGKTFTVVLYGLLWAVRYFFVQLYLRSYLSKGYGDEEWFIVLDQVTSLIIILLGIVFIKSLFLGSLRKNLFTEMMIEVVYTLVTDFPLQLLEKHFVAGISSSLTMYPKLWYVLLLIWFLVPIIIVIRYTGPLIVRYRDWEVKHPLLLDVVLVVFFGVSILSNIQFVNNLGRPDYHIFVIAVIMLFLYYRYDYFKNQRLKQMSRLRELSRREEAVKQHYVNTIIQMGKIENYNKEIRETIDRMLQRLMMVERKTYVSDSPDMSDGRNENTDEMIERASRYLEEMNRQYDELTLQRYCSVYEVNQLLEEYEKRFMDTGIQPVFMMRDYSVEPTDYELLENVEQIIRWMFEEIIDWKKKEPSETISRQDNPSESVLLQGGIIGKELVISCEAFGGRIKNPDTRRIRKLIKKMKGDMDVQTLEGEVKVVIGIPIENDVDGGVR